VPLAAPAARAPCFSIALWLCRFSRGKDISGGSFAMAAQVLLDKWAARSCDPKVLATVRKEVFNIDEPKK
jgi:hypothetical protein